MKAKLLEDIKVVGVAVLAVVVPLALVGGAMALSGWLVALAYNYVVFDWLHYADWPRMHWLVGCAVMVLTGVFRSHGGKS